MGILSLGGGHWEGTLPETNIAPKNGWLEYYFPIGDACSQGRFVSFRESALKICPWKSL